jgi:16S rRNA (guanine(966)-N(2))-methyltransferase RsmD
VRIISGKYKGRQIHTPNNLPVRPTTDFAKEGLFNILNNLVDFEEISVLDLFAGTGNISYEFFSRGAVNITAVEIDPKCKAFIDKTIQLLNAESFTAIRADVFYYLKRPYESFDIIFADPPYQMEKIDEIPDLIFQSQILKNEGWFILEHSKRHDFSNHPFFDQHRKYGNVNFSFFRLPEPKPLVR